MKKIIHIDMDAFFASVEIRDNPSLRGKPVIVGGAPNSRGVVSTCSYEARKYGVHSAMASSQAYRLCPHGIFLQPHFEKYKEVSHHIRKIFYDYTDLVEPLSIDEAYLDVTENKYLIPYATRIAREIKRRIFKETGGLTASAGVSYNLFLAKVASDVRKPDGLFVIRPEDAEKFLEELPVGKFYGIGRVTEKFLLEHKIRTGADLKRLSEQQLSEWFGKTGRYYYQAVRGIDHREVTPVRTPKSQGTECTFSHDLTELPEIAQVLFQQAKEVSAELKKHNLKGRTIVLKIKFFDFRQITRSRTIDELTDDPDVIGAIAVDLLQNTEAGKIAVRLCGVTVTGFPEEMPNKDPEESRQLIQMEFDFGDEL